MCIRDRAVATTSNVQFNNVQVDGVLTSNDITSTSISIDGNATITGNLTVEGTSTQVDSTTVTVADPLFKYAKDNTGNSVDIGFYGKYVQSATTKYAGLIWDASTSDKFRLFHGNQTEPSTTVDLSGTGHTTGTLIANLEGNVTGNVTGNVSGSSGSTTGNAATATALATGRTIGMTGDVVWTSASFDGSGNVTGSATIQAGAVENSMLADDAVGADELAANAVVNASVASGAAIDATKIHDGTISNTEFGHLNNVSSNIQTQIDAKTTLTAASNEATALAIALG